MAKRIHKMIHFIQNQQIDALLIKSKTMKRYMDTMTGSGCKVLFIHEKGYLIVDGRYITEAKEKEQNLQIRLLEIGQSYLEVVNELLEENHCTSLGVEMDQISIFEYEQLKKFLLIYNRVVDKMKVVYPFYESVIIKKPKKVNV